MQWDAISFFTNFLNEFLGENGGRPSPPTLVSSLTPQNRLLPQIRENFKGLIWENGLLLNYLKNMGGTLQYGLHKNKKLNKNND
jgi:hypothetical protein